VNHPSELLKKGDEVEAVITNIDAVNQRLSLSMKALQPDIWERFFQNHYVGDVVPGAVTKIVDFGAFVDLGDGVEGLVHISELSDKHITNCAEVVEVGQSYPFKVIRLEPADKRIGLSLKEGQRRERQHKEREDETPHPVSVDDSRTSLGDVVDFRGFQRKEEDEQ
jgi:ribosomal protein S1